MPQKLRRGEVAIRCLIGGIELAIGGAGDLAEGVRLPDAGVMRSRSTTHQLHSGHAAVEAWPRAIALL